jgi:hypothetical protein
MSNIDAKTKTKTKTKSKECDGGGGGGRREGEERSGSGEEEWGVRRKRRAADSCGGRLQTATAESWVKGKAKQAGS